MYTEGKLWIANNGDTPIYLLPKMANRHGLIAGATGTGKTCTLKQIAESFSEAGVPVFLADVKGDLAATCKSYPVAFWDIFGKNGMHLRTTISEMGPTLLARFMDLTQTQEDVLTMVFKIADDQDLLLIDTKDLKSMITYVSENNKEFSENYGNMSKATLNVILRSVIALEDAGGEEYFGEPALNIKHWFKTDIDTGRGVINILDSSTLINSPKIYSTFMLWLMSELFEVLPEAGDLDKPKMVFFFDEAHLLFDDAPKALLSKVEQVIKLVRSKGVGIYFITQSPKDIPDGVLAQLSNKVQHALRAYTPADQKGVKAAAESFRANPEFDTKEAIMELGTGEALISFLQEDGTPAIVQRAKVIFPTGEQGTITEDERKHIIENNPLSMEYSDAVDRDSAYEFFQRKKVQDDADAKEQAEKEAAKKAEEAAEKQRLKEEAEAQKAAEKEAAKKQKEEQKAIEKEEREKEKAAKQKEKQRKSAVASVAKSAGGTVGREVGNTIGSAVGGKFGKKLGGNLGSSLARGILGTLLNR